MNYLRLVIALSLTGFMFSCTSIQEGFVKKKNNSDEFLVEKKSPLIMPPNYGDLPMPKETKKSVSNQNEIESLINKSESKEPKSKKNTSNSLEEDLLEKIKDN